MSFWGKSNAALACAAGFAVLALGACNPAGGAQNTAPPTPEVGVVTIAPQAFDETIQLTARVSAFEVSEVRPQIGGIVRSRRFTEGATVRAGQVLYEIDPGPARADLSAAQAAAASSHARYERYQNLAQIDAVSRQELDDARAASDQAAAALQNARINSGYTRVTAPISGIIGASSVTPGALATPAQATPFAVIQQIDQVYVDMTMSSAQLLRIRQQLGESAGAGARVRIRLQDGTEYAQDGRLQFSDVTVSQDTGTVRLRALFPNREHLLLPGLFVQAEVSVGTNPQAILAPQRGVTRNARGEAVAMILSPRNVVEERVIQTGSAAGDQWLVTSGLNAGDRLIVEGVQRVRPGAPATGVAPTASAPAREGDATQLRGREG